MKKIIILIVLLYSGISSNAQITLAHSYGPPNSQSEIVNLSLSGKKIMIINSPNYINDSGANIGETPDTINFYNMDFSFWKRIICPTTSLGVHFLPSISTGYPSETLFNTDPLLEMAIYYNQSGVGKIYIINENGIFVDSIVNVSNYMKIYDVDTLGIGFQAVVNTPTGVAIYNLPGTLPCSTCSGNGLGVAKVEKSKDGIQTQPLPNPSSTQVKITFTLPQGVNQANLVLYSTTGQKIRSFVVDNTFGYILLDNSQLASGVYYYNIEANGIISSTQKMVVIK